jgi:hypothetical protein
MLSGDSTGKYAQKSEFRKDEEPQSIQASAAIR